MGLVLDASFDLSARQAPDACSPDLVADFSALGGPSVIPLEPDGDGVWRLRASLSGDRRQRPANRGRHCEPTVIAGAQRGSPDPYPRRGTADSHDLVMFGDAPAPGRDLVHRAMFEDRDVDFAEDTSVRGRSSRRYPRAFRELGLGGQLSARATPRL